MTNERKTWTREVNESFLFRSLQTKGCCVYNGKIIKSLWDISLSKYQRIVLSNTSLKSLKRVCFKNANFCIPNTDCDLSYNNYFKERKLFLGGFISQAALLIKLRKKLNALPVSERWTVMKNIYLSIVLKYTFSVSILYLSKNFWKLMTLTALHLKDKYCTFTLLHFYQAPRNRKSLCNKFEN